MRKYISLSLILFFSIAGFAQCDPAFTSTSNLAELTFRSQNADPGVEHIWDFGDGTSGTGATVSHTFPLPGPYDIKHIVRSESGGCADSVSILIHVDFQMTCDAAFTITRDSMRNGMYILTPVTFGGTSARYVWTIDGQPVGSLSPFEVYIPEGVHEICLENTLINCVATSCQTLDVPALPTCNWTASFTTAASASSPRKITFAPSVSSLSMKFKWYFGDGSTSTAATPTYEYAYPGEYDVRLHIKDTISNCYDTVSQHLSLAELPSDLCNASFTYTSDPTNPARISFTAASNQDITHQTWHIVAVDSSHYSTLNVFNPTHNFPDTGYYYVMLELTTITGCVNRYWEYVRISSVPLQSSDVVLITPNPAYGAQISLQVEVQKPDPVKISVYNSSGILVYTSQRQVLQGINQLNIPVDRLQRGLYYINIQGGVTRKKSTFIKL